MKTTILIFSMLISLSGCNDDNANKQETPVIIGTWKLIKVEYVWLKSAVIDYSKSGITYEFKPNGVLKIDANDNEDFESGVFEYEFGKFSISSLEGDPKSLIVKIDGKKWSYSLNNGIMVLGMSYIDGADLHFKRK